MTCYWLQTSIIFTQNVQTNLNSSLMSWQKCFTTIRIRKWLFLWRYDFFFVLVSHIRVHLHNNCSIYFSEKTRCIQCLWPPQLLWCWCGPRVWRTPCQWSASTIGKFSKFVSCFGRKRCFSACCWHTWSQNHHQFQYSNEFIVAAMRKALPTTRW